MEPLTVPPDFFASSNRAITWLTNDTRHILICPLPDSTWLQISLSFATSETKINRLESTEPEWRDYFHRTCKGWTVKSCHIQGVQIREGKVCPEEPEEEEPQAFAPSPEMVQLFWKYIKATKARKSTTLDEVHDFLNKLSNPAFQAFAPDLDRLDIESEFVVLVDSQKMGLRTPLVNFLQKTPATGSKGGTQ
jgi:hypothetical protein